MFTRKLFILAALSLSALAAASGCATEMSEEEASDSEAELSRSGLALIGAYKADTGSFRGLILTPNRAPMQTNEFIADVSTGGVCAKPPCPATERIKGTFTADKRSITLRAIEASSQHLLGRYNYLVEGSKFSLWKETAESLSLEKVESYCSVASDCYDQEQDILDPACRDLSFTCTPQTTCSRSCGGPTPPLRPTGDVCQSSSTCASGQHCSTEDGICNRTGTLAVCSGTCVK